MDANVTSMSWVDRFGRDIPGGRSRFTLEVDVERGSPEWEVLIACARLKEPVEIEIPVDDQPDESQEVSDDAT